MIHRKFKFQNFEFQLVDSQNWCGAQEPSKAAPQRRRLQQLLNDPVLLAFGPAAASVDGGAATRRFSGLQNASSLPHNVHLLTTLALEDGSLLLRLAHLFQVHPRPFLEDCRPVLSPHSLRLDLLWINIPWIPNSKPASPMPSHMIAVLFPVSTTYSHAGDFKPVPNQSLSMAGLVTAVLLLLGGRGCRQLG